MYFGVLSYLPELVFVLNKEMIFWYFSRAEQRWEAPLRKGPVGKDAGAEERVPGWWLEPHVPLFPLLGFLAVHLPSLDLPLPCPYTAICSYDIVGFIFPPG